MQPKANHQAGCEHFLCIIAVFARFWRGVRRLNCGSNTFRMVGEVLTPHHVDNTQVGDGVLITTCSILEQLSIVELSGVEEGK